MTAKKKLPKPQEFGLQAFTELLTHRIPIPGEAPGSYRVFQKALLKTLLPTTPYECVIAENLILIEWELLQRRRMRDQVIRKALMEAIRDAARGPYELRHNIERMAALNKWEDEGNEVVDFEYDEFDPTDAEVAATKLAEAARDPSPVVQAAFQAKADALGLDLVSVMCRTYSEEAMAITSHDESIEKLERRRRSVKADLDSLQRARPVDGQAQDVADAEIIEA